MLPRALQSAESPAQALPRQYRNRLRNLGIGDGMFVIADHISPATDGKRQVGILGNSVSGVSACLEDGASAPRTRCSWNNRHCVQQVECSSIKVEACDVLDRL